MNPSTLLQKIVILSFGMSTLSAYALGLGQFKFDDSNDYRLTFTYVNSIPNDGLCVAGFAFDPEEAKSVAVGLTMDRNSAEVRMSRIVKPLNKFHQNRFSGCFALSGNIYFIEESDTQSSPELSQVMIHLTAVPHQKSDALERTKLWMDGKRNWLSSLAIGSAHSLIILGHDPRTPRDEATMTLHPFPGAAVAADGPITVKHGSFMPGANSVFDGKLLRIAGQFSKTGDFSESTKAKASISAAGHYIWSSPVQADGSFGSSGQSGKIFEALPNRLNQKVLIKELGDEKIPGRQLAIAESSCKPNWLISDFVLIGKSCNKNSWDVHYLEKGNRIEVNFPFNKIVPGPRELFMYSPEKSKSGEYSIGIFTP